MKWYAGLFGLISCQRGIMCLLILALSFIALFTHHLDSPSAALIVGSVATIFCAAHAYINRGVNGT